MASNPDRQEDRAATRGPRGLRKAIVFALVVLAAALLGQLGSELDAGPAREVERSAPGASAVA